jgi:hypothetical protein
VHLGWARGGEAELTALDSTRITLLSTVPMAPGSSPEGALLSGAGTLRVKVARCRRQGDRFLVEGRLLDVPRDLHAALVRLVAPPPAEGTGGRSGP